MEDIVAQLDLPASLHDQTDQISRVVELVQQQMAIYDPSHNPQHAFRVTRQAHALLRMEREREQKQRSEGDADVKASSEGTGGSGAQYDDLIVTLSALLHDLSDHKYVHPSNDSDSFVHTCLYRRGFSFECSAKVQTIVSNVSFSREKWNPDRPRELIANGYPELAIVQDSDRLDAIGAVGIGRCFTYLGARRPCGNCGRWDLDMGIDHFVEKLEGLEAMMKTHSGRELARTRTERLKEFRRWWTEETGYVPDMP